MDHDRLFKKLLHTFFADFIELFFPELAATMDMSTVEFLDKEIFTDLTGGRRHKVDLLVKARFTSGEGFFLIHIESQGAAQEIFPKRMFHYFARLHENHDLPIYPIALLSYDAPQRPEPDHYQVTCGGLNVMNFNSRVIQLNRLNWKEFIRRPNPVAAALMTKMKIEPGERPKVMLECLRMIATLKLDSARQTLIKSFMDAYLKLGADEQKAYNQIMETIDPQEREAVTQIVDQWEERGQQRGIRLGETAVIVRQLKRKFGQLPETLVQRIGDLGQDKLEELADAVLDFKGLEDVQSWLAGAG